MAQPIHCDLHDLAHPADVLVTRLDSGETIAACDPAYVELCRQLVEAIDAPEREAADAEALRKLGEAEPGIPVTAEPGSLADRILNGEADDSADPPTFAGSSGEAVADPAPRSKPAGGRKRAGPAARMHDPSDVYVPPEGHEPI